MTTTRSIISAISGVAASASARFVSGPSVSTVTGRSAPAMVLVNNSTAVGGAANTSPAGRIPPYRPSACARHSAGNLRSPSSGSDEPHPIGTSESGAASSTSPAALATPESQWTRPVPDTVIASTSTAGCCSR